MLLTDTKTHYGLISKIIHWTIALLIILLIVLGWWMVDLGFYDPYYHKSLTWHKSLGLIVGFIVGLKLLWRLINKPPDPQASLTTFERAASKVAHKALFVAMLVLPLSGYLISTSQGAPIEVFTWFEFPALLTVADSIRDIVIVVHFYAAYATLGVVLIHASAAIKHQILDSKGTMKRMM